MKIQVKNHSPKDSVGFWKKSITLCIRFSSLILLLIILFSSFLLGGIAHKEGFFGQVLKPVIETNIRIPYRYLRSLFVTPEQLSLDIKHIDFQKLAFKREQALETGVLHSSSEDFVPAKIRWNNKTINVSVRLKGDLEDHWADKLKWSFRVKTKNRNTILGMQEFSLQHPKTRGFLNDWFLHKLLGHLGAFIVLRYDFVQLSVNGKDFGIYLIEEHFDEKLLANNNYINAPIIRIYDHLLWYGIDPKVGFTKTHLNEHYTLSPIDAFNSGQISRDEVQFKYFNRAKYLLESFRQGRLSTHEVFDVEKLAQLFATIDLLGYHHSTAYSNIRFYYNPATSLLDPIGYDNTFIMKAQNIEGEGKEIKLENEEKQTFNDYENEQLWYNKIFEDEFFYRNYIKHLNIICNRDFLDNFFSKVNSEYENKLDILYRTFPGYNFKYRNTIYENQEYIRTVLNPIEAIQAYFHSIDPDNHLLVLEVGNIQSLPIEIIGVSGPDGIFAKVDRKTILQPKQKLRFIQFQSVNFQLPVDYKLKKDFSDNIHIVYNILGNSKKMQTTVFPWRHLAKTRELESIDQTNLPYTAFPFFEVDSTEKTITVKPGTWTLDRSINIPEGYTLFCGPGTILDMINSARIISYSSLNFKGTKEKPIVIHSTDKTGQGIIILSAASKSFFNHILFQDFTGPINNKLYNLQAPLVFYETFIEMKQCYFENCLSETAVSFVKSVFKIEKSVFMKCNNALTSYYSNGVLANLIIIECEKNGINSVSSTLLGSEISQTNIKGIAFLISENSLLKIKQIICQKSNICIFVTDGSEFNSHNLFLKSSNVGISVYNTQSKSESSGRVVLNGVDIVDVKEMFKLDNKSSLSIDGKSFTAKTKKRPL